MTRHAAIVVVRAAGLSTVQDAGRPGHMHEGVPPGGALVAPWLARANAAVDNAAGEAAIEVFGAATFAARGRVEVATDDGVRRVLEDAETMEVVCGPSRVRYLAVRGGFDVPRVLGGRGTLIGAGFGGHEGRALRRGDVLAVGDAAALPHGGRGLPSEALEHPLRPPPELPFGAGEHASRAHDLLSGPHDLLPGALDLLSGPRDVLPGALDLLSGPRDVLSGALDLPSGAPEYPSRASEYPSRASGYPSRALEPALRGPDAPGMASGLPVEASEMPDPGVSLIRILPGPDAGDGGFERLLASRLTIDPRSNRVGIRLAGFAAPPTGATQASDVSSPMVRGAIQLPPDGVPIVLGPDHPTTGGYPVVAFVISCDQARLAARPVGGRVQLVDVRFVEKP